MEDDKSGGGDSSRAASSFMKKGDRKLFRVDLQPGETTIVSWKKLVKDANKLKGPTVQRENPDPAANPSLESRLAPGQAAESEQKNAPAGNRFSSVIEKIERLYVNNSSDEEDLDDIPDDDQYDTEDSFIDDTELDDYFKVDNSSTKHDGFFVNRGRLERIEPPVQTAQQLKKRRRKDVGKSQVDSDNDRVSNKHLKAGKTAAGKATTLTRGSQHVISQNLGTAAVFCEDGNMQHQQIASEGFTKKKLLDTKVTVDPPSPIKVSDGELSIKVPFEIKDADKQNTGSNQSKNLSNKLKTAPGASDRSHQRYSEKGSVSGRPLNVVDEQKLSARARERPDVSGSGAKHPVQMKSQHLQKRDASSVRPKGSGLERAIRDLEKMVAESRPPALENQEPDAASQNVKRRLPPEIKQKLAKVARIAQACHGRISKELLNRLMSIVGHLIQLRTLKRNLNVMISMGISAKQEKDDKFQKIKKELSEMITMQVRTESKEPVQQVEASDDFQDFGSEDKGARMRLTTDAALEDKICDIYDLYVDGLDEEAGPQIRKLYAELAQLWPNGLMDNHGIKRAICRAKERRRTLQSKSKDQEKTKRRKVSSAKEETTRPKGSLVAQPQFVRERVVNDGGSPGLPATSGNKLMSNMTAAVRMPNSSIDGISLEKGKHEKLKGGSENALDDTRVADNGLQKKKVKRKPEMELDGGAVRSDKLPACMGEEKNKSHKQATLLPHKISPQTAAPSFEQSS